MSGFDYSNIAFSSLYRTDLPQKTYNKVKYNAPQELYIKNGLVRKGAENTIAPKEKENKYKKLNTILLTLSTVVGLAVLGNKSSDKMAKLGQKVDDFLINKKWYKNLSNKTSNAKQKVKNSLLNSKHKFIKDSANDIAETFTKRHAKPSMNIAKGYGQGFTSIFALTPTDVLRTSLEKIEKANPGQGIKSLEKLVGKEKASQMYKTLMNDVGVSDHIGFCNDLTDSIAKNFKLLDKNGKTDKKQLLNFFLDLEKGKVKNVDLKEFTNIKMDSSSGIGAFMSNWWPVNFIDDIGKKVKGENWKGFCRGNLGDALIKYNSVNGSLANTTGGKLVQNILTVPCESISNFVNDKSGMGVMLALMIGSLYNNAQDAPEGKKISTVANDYVGTLGSMVITTPLAFTTTYGLASLKNLEGKTTLTKMLRQIGNIIGYGHDKIGKNGEIIKSIPKTGFTNKLKRFSGHSLRFILIMFVLSSIISKPINKITHKIFGKPYDPNEAEQMEKMQAMINSFPPEIRNNPKFIALMKDPRAAQLLSDPETLQKLIAEQARINQSSTGQLLNITQR